MGPEEPRDDQGDRDRDHILDRCDRCPDHPESYNTYQDDDGCPEELAVYDTGWGHPAVTDSVYFEHGSVEILASSQGVLRQVAAIIKRQPEVELVACIGQAAGDEPHPLDLSQKRATAVCQAIADQGVASERLTPHGMGDTPMAQDATDRPTVYFRKVSIQTFRQKAPEWYQGSIELARWNGKTVEPLEWQLPDEPHGPPACPLQPEMEPADGGPAAAPTPLGPRCLPVAFCSSFFNPRCVLVGNDGSIQGQDMDHGYEVRTCPGEEEADPGLDECIDFVEHAQACTERLLVREPGFVCVLRDGSCEVVE